MAFVLISKIYRQMYADTGIATDSARVTWSGRWARWLAKHCRHLFAGKPMPDLQVPDAINPMAEVEVRGDPSTGLDVPANLLSPLPVVQKFQRHSCT